MPPIRRSRRRWAQSIARRCALTGLAMVVAALSTGCALRAAPKAAAAAVPSDWSQVTNLAPRARLKVKDTAGLLTAGQFIRADATHLTVLSMDRDVVFEKARVTTVILEERQTGRKAKRGFTFGALAGALVGLFGTRSNQVPWAAMLAAGWGSVGFLIGATDGATDIHRVVIYDVAPQSGSLEDPQSLRQP